jgi:hypothetical protein
MNSSQVQDQSPRIDPQERISRYLLRERWFDAKANVVFAQAFNPPKSTLKYPIRQTSVYRTQEMAESEIWQVGDEFVTKLHPEHRPVLGRADISASEVLAVDLRIVPVPDPHPRHADIEGWPSEDEQVEMKLAYLSSKARLVVRS